MFSQCYWCRHQSTPFFLYAVRQGLGPLMCPIHTCRLKSERWDNIICFRHRKYVVVQRQSSLSSRLKHTETQTEMAFTRIPLLEPTMEHGTLTHISQVATSLLAINTKACTSSAPTHHTALQVLLLSLPLRGMDLMTWLWTGLLLPMLVDILFGLVQMGQTTINLRSTWYQPATSTHLAEACMLSTRSWQSMARELVLQPFKSRFQITHHQLHLHQLEYQQHLQSLLATAQMIALSAAKQLPIVLACHKLRRHYSTVSFRHVRAKPRRSALAVASGQLEVVLVMDLLLLLPVLQHARWGYLIVALFCIIFQTPSCCLAPL